MAPAVRDAIEALRTAVESGIGAISAAASVARLSTPEVVEGGRQQLRQRVDRLERRLRAAAAKSEKDAVRDLAAIRASVHPEGERQERALNFIPFFARYGEPLVDRLRDGAAIHAAALIGTR